MSAHDVELLKYQIQALTSPSRETGMIAGIGTGKSFTAAMFTIKMCFENPKSKGFIGAPTFSVLMNATVSTLISVLDTYSIPYTAVLSGSSKHIKINGVRVYLYSMDNYEMIRGIEIGWGIVDEAAFCKQEAIKVLQGRLRHKAGPHQLLYISSPNGYNWMYDMFGDYQTKRADNRYNLIQAKTKDNIFLPDGYYESLVDSYGGEDSSLAKQELFGKFVNMFSGAIYWGFKRDLNTQDDLKLDPKYPVYVGMDFNIDQMNAVLMQNIGKKLYVCERIQLTDTGANTYDMAKHLVDNYQGKYDLRVIPDSTGKARKTSSVSSASDIEILRQQGLKVEFTKNPFIRDRQNSVNIQFKAGYLVINSKLKDLIKEIETLAARDKEGQISHAAVAMGYVVWHVSPTKRIYRRNTPSGSIQL